MTPMPDYSDGPLAVGLFALHDKKFFQSLVENPEKALQGLADTGKLNLSKEDRDKVIRLIRAANDTGWKPLDEWERYKKEGFWGGGWPLSWQEPTRSRQP